MIKDSKWYLGGMPSSDNTAKSFYSGERNNAGYGDNPTTYGPENASGNSTKIGLMYVSDYGYAAYPNAWTSNLSSYNSSTIKSNNWIYMGLYDWTITPYSLTSWYVFLIYYNDDLNCAYTSFGGSSIRPVFYLKSNILYDDGDGSKSSPYRVSI